MPSKPIPRNAPCPCGSGRKYKHCCMSKGFTYEIDESGEIHRRVPVPRVLARELQASLEQQRLKFIEEHGREPGPDDRVFFDAPHLEHLEADMAQSLRKAGLSPAYVHAFEKTGLLVTTLNKHLISEVDLKRWQAAVEEYERRLDAGAEPPTS